MLFISFLHSFHIFQGHLYFILLINLFCTKFLLHFSPCGFTKFYSVLFNNLRTFFFEETLSFRWLKTRNKMFALYLRKVYVMKYIPYENIKMECGEPLHKKVACLHVIFILQHFDWLLCIIRKVIGRIIFKVVTS